MLLGSRILVLSAPPGRIQAVLDVPEDEAARAARRAELRRLLLPEPAHV